MRAAGKTNAPRATREALAPNAFVGHTKTPDNAKLSAALGPAKPLWDRVVSALIAENPELVPEWKCSSPKLGWGMRLQQKKRTIVHFSACQGSFRVGFVFGDRALRAVRAAFRASPQTTDGGDEARRILELIAAAPRYAEGTGVRIAVTEKDLPAICTLVKIKISN